MLKRVRLRVTVCTRGACSAIELAAHEEELPDLDWLIANNFVSLFLYFSLLLVACCYCVFFISFYFKLHLYRFQHLHYRFGVCTFPCIAFTYNDCIPFWPAAAAAATRKPEWWKRRKNARLDRSELPILFLTHIIIIIIIINCFQLFLSWWFGWFCDFAIWEKKDLLNSEYNR